MAFTHNVRGKSPHKHVTIAEARLCEQGRQTITTIKVRGDDGIPVQREAQHENPCVCGVYDKCWEFRQADFAGSGNMRDLFRAYND